MAIAAGAPGGAVYMQMRRAKSCRSARHLIGAVDSLLRPRGPFGGCADLAAAAAQLRAATQLQLRGDVATAVLSGPCGSLCRAGWASLLAACLQRVQCAESLEHARTGAGDRADGAAGRAGSGDLTGAGPCTGRCRPTARPCGSRAAQLARSAQLAAFGLRTPTGWPAETAARTAGAGAGIMSRIIRRIRCVERLRISSGLFERS